MNNIANMHMVKETTESVMGLLDGMGLVSGNEDYQRYTLNHKQAFLICQYSIVGRITGTALSHDTDKLFLYGVTTKKEASRIHTKYANHHLGNFDSTWDAYDCIIDYECARYTKPDKPLNALETIMKYSPESYELLRPILDDLDLNSCVHRDIGRVQSKVTEVLCNEMKKSVEIQLKIMSEHYSKGVDIDTLTSMMYGNTGGIL